MCRRDTYGPAHEAGRTFEEQINYELDNSGQYVFVNGMLMLNPRYGNPDKLMY